MVRSRRESRAFWYQMPALLILTTILCLQVAAQLCYLLWFYDVTCVRDEHGRLNQQINLFVLRYPDINHKTEHVFWLEKMLRVKISLVTENLKTKSRFFVTLATTTVVLRYAELAEDCIGYFNAIHVCKTICHTVWYLWQFLHRHIHTNLVCCTQKWIYCEPTNTSMCHLCWRLYLGFPSKHNDVIIIPLSACIISPAKPIIHTKVTVSLVFGSVPFRSHREQCLDRQGNARKFILASAVSNMLKPNKETYANVKIKGNSLHLRNILIGSKLQTVGFNLSWKEHPRLRRS